jgi:hypothetical protein
MTFFSSRVMGAVFCGEAAGLATDMSVLPRAFLDLARRLARDGSGLSRSGATAWVAIVGGRSGAGPKCWMRRSPHVFSPPQPAFAGLFVRRCGRRSSYATVCEIWQALAQNVARTRYKLWRAPVDGFVYATMV